MTEVSIPRNNL